MYCTIGWRCDLYIVHMREQQCSHIRTQAACDMRSELSRCSQASGKNAINARFISSVQSPQITHPYVYFIHSYTDQITSLRLRALASDCWQFASRFRKPTKQSNPSSIMCQHRAPRKSAGGPAYRVLGRTSY